MKPIEYYSTVTVPYPSKDELTNVFVYQNGKVLWTGSMVDFRTVVDSYKGCLVEKVVNEEGLKEQRRLYGAEVSRLEAEFKADLFEEHDVTDNPKAGLCYGKAWERGHAYGYIEVASIFDDLVDLIK